MSNTIYYSITWIIQYLSWQLLNPCAPCYGNPHIHTNTSTHTSTQTSRDNNMTGRGLNCGRLLKCKVLLWVLTNQKVYCSKIIANHYSVQISMWNGLIQMENIFMEPKKTKSESDSLKSVFYLGTNLLTPMEYSRNANSPFLVHVFHGCLL